MASIRHPTPRGTPDETIRDRCDAAGRPLQPPAAGTLCNRGRIGPVREEDPHRALYHEHLFFCAKPKQAVLSLIVGLVFIQGAFAKLPREFTSRGEAHPERSAAAASAAP